jgi:hypothetical protein
VTRPLVAHNAGLDIAFLNAELKRTAKPQIAAEVAALVGDNAVIGVVRRYFGTMTRKVDPTSMLLKMKYTP